MKVYYLVAISILIILPVSMIVVMNTQKPFADNVYHEFVGEYKQWEPNTHETFLYFDNDRISFSVRADHLWKYMAEGEMYRVKWHEEKRGEPTSCIGIYYVNVLDSIEDMNGNNKFPGN